MKAFKALALSLLLSLPATAHAQWYGGADGGANFLEDSSIKGADSDGSTKAGSDVGYALQFHGGYAFRSFDLGTPRVEGELGYRNSGLKSLTDMDGKLSGHTSALSLMTNTSFQFLPKRSWHPFVGAGIGMARIGVDWQSSSGKLVDDTDWVFAYQGFAGVSYDLAKNWELSAQYRYFATEDPEFSATDGSKFTGEYSSHAIMAGFAYKFGK